MKTLDNKEEKLLYQKTYSIKYYEMDFNQVLKPSALLNFLQDMATENAQMLGFGASFTFENNYAWFLVKYHMEFDEYPCALDGIVIKTEPRGVNKIIANRDFEIWNSRGNRLGRAASNWTLVDLNTKNILPIAKVIPCMIHFEKRESDMNFIKITPPEKTEFEKTFEIRFDDIDINRHVNNANYIVWAFEALPYDFKAQYRLKILDIAYKKEIAFGHKVVSCVQISEENGQKVSLHAVKNATTQEELCLVKALWI